MELGVGIIILLILWSLTAFLWILCSRSNSKLRVLVTSAAVLLTLILFLIPTETSQVSVAETQDFEIYDYVFIWRGILIVILCLSILGGVAATVTQSWTMKIHASDPVPRLRSQDEWE